MLSLNSVPDNKAQAREISQARPRSANGDERETRPDFQAMVVAAVQPAKIEQQPLRTKEADEIYQQRAPKAETPAPAGSNNSTNEIKGDAIHTPKAGHEAAKAEPTEGESKAKQPAPEASAATTAQTRKSSHDMLQALGLATLTARTTTAKAAQKTQPGEPAQQTSGTLSAAARLQAVRTQTATSTLNLLQKAPDAILVQNDGLKRLSEKIGIGFLSKFAEKLNEKTPRSDGASTFRPESARDSHSQTASPMANKAGHNNSRSESEADAKNNQRGARNQTTRNVSRETSPPLSPPHAGGMSDGDIRDQNAMVSPSNHDITTTRQQSPVPSTGQAGLADAAANAHNAETIRAAVENPLMRPELVRQFNEVMTRAQVLVTDADNARFSVKLFPRELGRMEIDLKLVDGEMRGKIVVESEDVKNEMQNFLQNRENNQGEEATDLSKVSIEVRSESQNAQTSDSATDNAELLQNLVTRTASVLYEAVDVPQQKGNALYA
jgi:hypothetical protein